MPRNGENWSTGSELYGCTAGLGIFRKRGLNLRRCCCSAIGLVPPRGSSNGWNDGVNDSQGGVSQSPCQKFLCGCRKQPNHRLSRKWLFRSSVVLSHLDVYFTLGQFHPSTKTPKNLPVRRRPEATSSACRIMFSDVGRLCQPILCFNPTILPTPCISRSPSYSTEIHGCCSKRPQLLLLSFFVSGSVSFFIATITVSPTRPDLFKYLYHLSWRALIVVADIART